MLSYREISPPSDLAAGVSCIWLMRDAGARGPGARERILPDGCVEIIFSIGDRFRHFRDGGPPVDQPSRLFLGPTTRTMVIEPTGTIDLVGIRLRPGGASALVPFHLREAADRSAAVEEAGLLPAGLRDRLGETDDPDARLAHVVAALRACWRPDALDARAAAACAAIARTHGTARIDDVARAAGVGRRTLERLFDRHVGVPPKRLARLARFQRVVSRATAADMHLHEAALLAGYFDQSHFLRDFGEFAGAAPRDLVRAPGGGMAEAFVTHSYNPGP
jgi:AraC-like DNA-binding protein